MSIVAAPLHRPATYPKATGYVCPVDGAPVVIDEWTVTTAGCDGEPNEDTGLGFYCTNKECVHRTEPIEEEDMQSTPRIFKANFSNTAPANRDVNGWKQIDLPSDILPS